MLERRKFDIPDIDKMVERQMRNWELARSQRLKVPTNRRPEVADFIAISREVGAGASEIALRIASRLNWPKFDKEILRAMAGDDATRHTVYESMDERDLEWWEEVYRSILEPDFVRNDYFRRLVKTTLSLARQGSAVFLGRGIDCMLPRDLGFRVRIVAPLDMRVERFAKRHNMSIEEARETVPEIDRAAFLMRVQHELPYAEIARALEVSLAAAKVKVHRVRRKLLATRVDEEATRP